MRAGAPASEIAGRRRCSSRASSAARRCLN